MKISRRQFVAGLGAAGAATAVPAKAAALLAAPARLYPPTDLSYFAVPISHGPPALRIGYASITWGGDDRKAIEDISSLGYPGIQLRANLLPEIPDPHRVKDLLAQHHLTFVALSSDGGVPLDPAKKSQAIKTHLKNARYLRQAGGKYLQVICAWNGGKTLTPAEYKQQGALLTEMAKRVADYGIQTGFHNHMDTTAQTPEAVAAILEASDPRYVKLELDIAHYFQGGGDPAAAIRQYHDRLLFLHLKDVQQGDFRHGYQFVELGQGKVNIPAVFKALHDVRFRGWGIVELDRVPEGSSRTPKECAEVSKEYLTKTLGVAV